MVKKRKEPEPKSEWVDPDDAPELTEEWFRKAHVYHGNVLISRGEGATREDRAVEQARAKDKKD